MNRTRSGRRADPWRSSPILTVSALVGVVGPLLLLSQIDGTNYDVNTPYNYPVGLSNWTEANGLGAAVGVDYSTDGGSGVVKKFECNANLGVVARDIKSYDGSLDRGSTLVVTMASSAQLQLLRVWLDARERRQLVVIALDEETVNECCNLGIAYLFDESSKLGTGKDMLFMSDEFLKIGSVKFSALRSILQDGYSVLFSEIDVYEFSDCEQCSTASESDSSSQHKHACVGKNDFDLEIHPNILPGKLAKPNSELNIGFFYMKSSTATIFLMTQVLECLDSGCGWDQKVFSSTSWKMQCQFVDDNAMDAHAPPVKKADKSESCLRVRVLNVYSYPTGGNKRQFGIVPPEYYKRTKTCPVLVHCTGRTGLAAKLDCLKRVQSLYANCTSSLSNLPL